MERISAYVIEKFQNRMISLYSIEGIEKIWMQPMAYHLDSKQKVTLFYKKHVSLHHLLHSGEANSLNQVLMGISAEERIKVKYQIAIQLAKIIFTLHNIENIKCHGHLSSHNIFVDLFKQFDG
jgi:hypothetical protein